jgi:hypothetical protein
VHQRGLLGTCLRASTCTVSLLSDCVFLLDHSHHTPSLKHSTTLVQSPPRPARACILQQRIHSHTQAQARTHKHTQARTRTPVLLFSEKKITLCVLKLNTRDFWPSAGVQKMGRVVCEEQQTKTSFVCVVYERNNVELRAHAPARVLPLPVYSYHSIAHRGGASATCVCKIHCVKIT